MLLFDESARQHHRCQRHRDVGRKFRKQLFCHHRPRRTAGGRHKRLLRRHLFQEILCLLDCAEIRADGDLHYIGKAKLAERRADLSRGHIAELSGEGGRNGGVNGCVALERGNRLKDLTFVDDRAEGTAHKAHPARNAFVMVNLRSAVFVGTDGVHAADLRAGSLMLDNGVVIAGVDAQAALDAFLLVDKRTSVTDADRLFWADLHARMLQAVLAGVCHKNSVLVAAVAGKFNDINERRLIVFFVDQARVNPVTDGGIAAKLAQG